MLIISTGNDTKLIAYSTNEFTNIGPHDICHAPQTLAIQLVCSNASSMLLIQSSKWLDMFMVNVKGGYGVSTTDIVARVKSKSKRKIIYNSMSSSQRFFFIFTFGNFISFDYLWSL